MSLDLTSIRKDFPILNRKVHQNQPLVYLDNAASTQKPLQVLETSSQYYQNYHSNIHRGAHALAQEATEAYESARNTLAKHFNTPSPREVLLTSGCTESINLVASILAKSSFFKKGDFLLISELEHHSNIVPWQMLCEITGAKIEKIPLLETGAIDLEAYRKLLEKPVKLVSFNHISNAFGIINPVKELTTLAKQAGCLVFIDGAQSAPHLAIDVQGIGCDFFACSGHKMYAPTGIGLLWGKADLLEKLPPWKGGGEMIKQVRFEKTTYNALPFKYEAGTPNIEGAIAFAAAIDYLNSLDINNIQAHESQLMTYAQTALGSLDDILIYGEQVAKAGALSFNFKNVHPYDLGVLLDQTGIAVRTGHHCCQPLMERFQISGTIRASFALYNTFDEIDFLLNSLQKNLRLLS